MSRFFLSLVLVLPAACKTTTPQTSSTPAAASTKAAPTSAPTSPSAVVETLARDTPRTTTEGNTFIAPAGWRLIVRGPATILEPPEGNSAIALVDVRANSSDAAVAAAWRAYRADARWPLKLSTKRPDKDGWTARQAYTYRTSPNEKRSVVAYVQRANNTWTVAVYDMAEAVGEKRLAQVALIFGRLLPKGFTRESFAGKKAHDLDKQRVAALSKYVETAMDKTGVPGVALGLIQNGKVVFAGGFGVRKIGSKKKIDASTLFLIASNTKALTTLMLAKLVDEKKLTWDTPVTSLLPSFKLGDAATTSQVQVKHLICACTGLPRQDFELLFQFEGLTPAGTMATLATMQPTSKFGEMFQYSNPLAGAGGYVGGRVAYARLELGAAYDRAMKSRVFGPLKMKSTTFSYAKALRRNHTMPHAPNIDGKPTRALMEINYAIIPARPAGGAWSNVKDVLAYVAMELAEGKLPGGKRYIAKETLLARRAPQVTIGKDVSYGMGLMVDTKYGVPVVRHGGDLIGFHSDMMWLPDHNVGAVILTNGDPGWLIRSQFQRKLLEVLFDGKPEADALVASGAKAYFAKLAANRKLLTIPPDPTEVGKLAKRYSNDVLGDIVVRRTKGGATHFDVGEWRSEVASRKNPDGTISFVTTTAGITGLPFVVGSSATKRTLTVRDAQHEYVFTEASK